MPIAIPAALMAVKGGLVLWKWIVLVVAVAALVGTVYVAKSRYDTVEQRKGYDKAEALYKPQLARAQAESALHKSNLEQALAVNAELVETNKKTVALYREQEAALNSVVSQSAQARAESRRVREVLAEQEASANARIADLLRKVSEPAVPGENVCEQTDSLVRSVVRERVRNYRTADAPAHRN